mmetsp:Transcript_53795/g.149285  ORF Transcript_53795/g.149285 Transcript_53795/m.149285 type:complete len:253 (+) Transcript_53795:121-879(+)
MSSWRRQPAQRRKRPRMARASCQTRAQSYEAPFTRAVPLMSLLQPGHHTSLPDLTLTPSSKAQALHRTAQGFVPSVCWASLEVGLTRQLRQTAALPSSSPEADRAAPISPHSLAFAATTSEHSCPRRWHNFSTTTTKYELAASTAMASGNSLLFSCLMWRISPEIAAQDAALVRYLWAVVSRICTALSALDVRFLWNSASLESPTFDWQYFTCSLTATSFPKDSMHFGHCNSSMWRFSASFGNVPCATTSSE